jgi:hypothetical protein
MNLTNLKTLIATVETAVKKDEFDMADYIHDCGTPGCIAAYAAILAPMTVRESFEDGLAKYLDIAKEEGDELSTGWYNKDTDDSSSQPEPQDAVKMLNRMLAEERTITWKEYFA